MPQHAAAPARPVAGRLDEIVSRAFGASGPLGLAAARLLERLGPEARIRPGMSCVESHRPVLLIEGWAAKLILLPDGRRQILDLCLPGDPLGLWLTPSPAAAAKAVALTPVRTMGAGSLVATLRSGDATVQDLRLAIVARSTAAEGRLLGQILRLGRLTAYERTCHLMMELRGRLLRSGLGQGSNFPMPLTQDQLADVLGLSAVHVNRTLQQLRRDKVLELSQGRAKVLNLEAMQAAF